MKKILSLPIEWILVPYFVWWFGTYALNLFEIVWNISTFLIVFYLIKQLRKDIIKSIEEDEQAEKEYQQYLKKQDQEQKAKVDRMFKMLEKI